VRVLGEITLERVEIARKADDIFISMIKEAGIYNEVSLHGINSSSNN
jgi:GMP synthase (glutamine-hydrolysing)